MLSAHQPEDWIKVRRKSHQKKVAQRSVGKIKSHPVNRNPQVFLFLQKRGH